MPYVAAPSDIARTHAEKRLAALATPPGALGRLGDLAVWVAACQGQVPPAPVDNVRLVIFAGDHGVAAHGVSAFPPAITGAMVRTFLLGKAGVSALANAHGVAVRVLDLGVDEDFDDLDEQVRTALTAHKIRRGSGAIHIEDALTGEQTQGRDGRRRRRRPGGDRGRCPAAHQRRHGHRQHHPGRGHGRRGARPARLRGRRPRHRDRRRGPAPQGGCHRRRSGPRRCPHGRPDRDADRARQRRPRRQHRLPARRRAGGRRRCCSTG